MDCILPIAVIQFQAKPCKTLLLENKTVIITVSKYKEISKLKGYMSCLQGEVSHVSSPMFRRWADVTDTTQVTDQ